eukprot:gene13419-17993_t
MNYFLSHAWGANRENHEKVLQIFQCLTNVFQIDAWIDEEELFGGIHIPNVLIKAVCERNIFLMFITKSYHDKINQGNLTDMCWLELKTAVDNHKIIIPILMEDAMRNPTDWTQLFGTYFRNQLYIDMSSPDIYHNNNFTMLEEKCRLIVDLAQRHNSGLPVVGNAFTLQNISSYDKICSKCNNLRFCEVFDDTDKIPVCQICAMVSNNHKITSIEQECNRIRDREQSGNQEFFRRKIIDIESSMNDINQTMESINRTKVRTEEEITVEFNKVRSLLDAKERSMKEEFSQECERRMDLLGSQLHHIQTIQTDLQNKLHDFQLANDSYPSNQVVFIKTFYNLKKVKEQIKSKSGQFSFPLAPVKDVEFDSIRRRIFILLLKEFRTNFHSIYDDLRLLLPGFQHVEVDVKKNLEVYKNAEDCDFSFDYIFQNRMLSACKEYIVSSPVKNEFDGGGIDIFKIIPQERSNNQNSSIGFSFKLKCSDNPRNNFLIETLLIMFYDVRLLNGKRIENLEKYIKIGSQKGDVFIDEPKILRPLMVELLLWRSKTISLWLESSTISNPILTIFEIKEQSVERQPSLVNRSIRLSELFGFQPDIQLAQWHNVVIVVVAHCINGFLNSILNNTINAKFTCYLNGEKCNEIELKNIVGKFTIKSSFLVDQLIVYDRELKSDEIAAKSIQKIDLS